MITLRDFCCRKFFNYLKNLMIYHFRYLTMQVLIVVFVSTKLVVGFLLTENYRFLCSALHHQNQMYTHHYFYIRKCTLQIIFLNGFV